MSQKQTNQTVSFIPRMMSVVIFSSRWLQAPLYIGLIIAQGIYVCLFMKELFHLINGAMSLSEVDVMLIVLGLIDIVMIANLLNMVIMGGYDTFVSRVNIMNSHPDKPEWLEHMDANTMKVKLAMALIGISSIHLLKTFINAPGLDIKTIVTQITIHMVFVISAVVMMYIAKMMPGNDKNSDS